MNSRWIIDCIRTYWQKWLTIVSKTKTGPVLPKIVNGWPANKWYKIPQIAPDRRLSIAAMLLSVALLKRPPKVIIGDKQAK